MPKHDEKKMPLKSVATKFPSWISKILLLEIESMVKEEISSKVKVLDARISALDSKLEERTKTLESEISSLRNEMLSLLRK